MDAMASPWSVRVRIDAQGRMVLPRELREEIVSVPGEIILRRTPDGLLLTSAMDAGVLRQGEDGLPVLSLHRPVGNAEVLDAIDRERAER